MTISDELKNLAEFYDLFLTGTPGDAAFYLAEAKRVRGKVLEVGCGTGRILLELLANDVDAYGVDLSPAMLAKLSEKAVAHGIDIRGRVSRQNMQRLRSPRKFKLIFIPYRVFLHNLTSREQLATLAACKQLLAPGGKIILNFFNFSPTVVAERVKKPGWKRCDVIRHDRRTITFFDRAEDDFIRQRINVSFKLVIRERGKKERVVAEHFPLAWIGKREFELLVERAGLKIAALFGGFDRRPFKNEKDELIWVLKK